VIDAIADAIMHLTRELHEGREQRGHEFHKLHHLLDKIMSAISDFAKVQTAFQDRVDAAITDLQGDVKSLNDQIAALQATEGTITAEDQALLDGIQSRSANVANKLEALDALTPPVAPKA
jgi:peptidoglycan hydrolase CwlO-like protein